MAEEIDNELPVEPPIPTTTITLEVVSADVKQLLLDGCEQQEAAAIAVGEKPDAYYQKVRDRLADDAEPGKVTIPDVILTPEVIDAIEAEIVKRLQKAKEDKVNVHPHVKQTNERLTALKTKGKQ